MGIFSNLFRRKEESNTFVFANKILELQKRIEAKIDKIQPVVYNLTTKEPIG